MYGIPLIWLIPLGLFLVLLFGSVAARLIELNNDLARARENEILNREIMRKQVQEAEENLLSARQSNPNAAYDRELTLLLDNKRFEDAIEYIDERMRLAFEQGNLDREDMYIRYRRDIQRQILERDSD